MKHFCVQFHLTHFRVKSFSEPLACHYLTQLLLAVTYLHEKGVYHRDIKPENCLVDKDFNLKLTDFGTNKVWQKLQLFYYVNNFAVTDITC